jgi:N-acetylmuramic acid 6-phosphate etherase
MLNTETPSTRHPDLDTYATPALLEAFIDDQTAAVAAVKAAAPNWPRRWTPRCRASARAAAAVCGRRHLRPPGRAGQRGAHPTFSWPRERP